MESSFHPLSGIYKPHPLKTLYYGPGVVKSHLLSVLPSANSKAFVITGNSLTTKTPLIKDLESLLFLSGNYAGTFSDITQHVPSRQLDEVTKQVDSTVDTIISVGGGSPIDSAKAVIFRVHEKSQKWLLHLTIPTTLSAAECTATAGYTQADGVKTNIAHSNVYPAFIFYDPKFGLYTPWDLFLSTGFRALDHAVEIQYYPYTAWIPTRLIALSAIAELFRLLPMYKANPRDEDVITGLFLAAYASLGFLGQNVKAGPDLLSHSLGYALGSPYGIPHGITSCLTLGHVVKLKAKQSKDHARMIAEILPYIGETRSGDDSRDSHVVGDKILGLVRDLGLDTTLTERGVGRDQLDIITRRAMGNALLNASSRQEEELRQAVRDLLEGSMVILSTSARTWAAITLHTLQAVVSSVRVFGCVGKNTPWQYFYTT